MRYFVILEGTQPASPPPAELMDAIMRLGAEAQQAGVLIDTQGLAPSAGGALVTVRGGDLSVTDGPFAESKEFLAGFWIVDVDSPQEAYAIAARASRAPGPGGRPLYIPIEVREVPDGPPVEP